MAARGDLPNPRGGRQGAAGLRSRGSVEIRIGGSWLMLAGLFSRIVTEVDYFIGTVFLDHNFFNFNRYCYTIRQLFDSFLAFVKSIKSINRWTTRLDDSL